MSSIIPPSTPPAHLHPAAKEARHWIWIGYIIGLVLLFFAALVGLFNLVFALVWVVFLWSPVTLFWGIFYLAYAVIGFFILTNMVKPKLIDAIDRGDYKTANDNIMTVGILALIFSGVITGLLIILAKTKLEEAIGAAAPPAPPPPPAPA